MLHIEYFIDKCVINYEYLVNEIIPHILVKMTKHVILIQNCSKQ